MYVGEFSPEYFNVRAWMKDKLGVDFIEEPFANLIIEMLDDYGSECDIFILDHDLFEGNTPAFSTAWDKLRTAYPAKPTIAVLGHHASGCTNTVCEALGSAVLRKPLTTTDMCVGLQKAIQLADLRA